MRRVAAVREARASGFSAIDARWRAPARACRTRRRRPGRRAPGRRSSRSRPRCSRRGTRATARRRSSRETPSRGRRGISPGRGAGRRIRTRARAFSMLAIETSSTNRCGATATTPATGWRAACSSAIEAPSLWPKSQGRSMPRRAKSRGRTSIACSCMKSGAQRSAGRLRRRAAVAVAREDEAGEAVRVAEGAREVLPHRDRAEPLVQEDDDVGRRSRGADPLVFEAELATFPVDAGERRLAPAVAHDVGPPRSRSRSRKRWILPVAVFGSSSTNSIARGYL